MNRQIGPPLLQRHFKLLHEQALAANLAQGAIENLVTQCGHAQYLDLMPELAQPGLNVFGLPQGQPAFAGRNNQFAHIQTRALGP